MNTSTNICIVKNNEISISPEEWVALNNAYTKDQIKLMISDAIEENELELPYRKISLEQAKESFQDLLDLDVSNLQSRGEWFSRYDDNYSFSKIDTFVPSDNSGSVASNYFMQSERWLADSINSPSPYRTWTTERFRLTLLNALWSLKVKKVDNNTLRSCIALRKYIASQFRPSAAKVLIDSLGAKTVLDFSSGWGDRLVGFLASEAETYIGIDPNTRLFPKYKKIIDQFNVDKKVYMFNACAEDINLGEYLGLPKEIDLILTSPPYFNIEKYTHEPNQSFKKYRKIDEWNTKFLHKSLDNSWRQLKSGGYMLINISDVYSNHTINEICEPMNKYMEGKEDAIYMGATGYQMKKRPNSKALKGKTGVFAEPIWMWMKK